MVRNIMQPFLDFRSKYEFFGTMANKANIYLESNKTNLDEKEFLLFVVSVVIELREKWIVD